MTLSPDLTRDLLRVLSHDIDAALHCYAWPPVTPTAEESREADRLRAIASHLAYRERVAEYEHQEACRATGALYPSAWEASEMRYREAMARSVA